MYLVEFCIFGYGVVLVFKFLILNFWVLNFEGGVYGLSFFC